MNQLFRDTVLVLYILGGFLMYQPEKSEAATFRLAELNGRSCLVQADGSPFFSLGINHIQNLTQREDVIDPVNACKQVFENLITWGFNTAGYGSPEPLTNLMPYFAPIYLTKNANYHSDKEFMYPDVFDPAVQERFREIIRYEIGKHDGNPNLIGYYWTDTPQWNLERARKTRETDWVSALRSLPDHAPGKKRYEAFRKESGATDDAFLRLIARELYRVVGEETRRLAPETLVFGERYLANDHPACVIEEALPYIDVLSIQPGGAVFPADYFDQLFETYQLPIIICDHQCSFPTAAYAKTMWQQMASEDAAGMAYSAYLDEAVRKPYILGYQRCQYIDVYEEHLGVLKQGMLQGNQAPYRTLVEYVSNANQRVMKLFDSECKRRVD
ncbi:MAG: hypothetical protein CBE26_02270 [Kiritimatiellaceae bacterium TMED266]|nr:MAG: hypothetical protein CBE26_02270 [Kiritimatiellaceae bacterium TMED266]